MQCFLGRVPSDGVSSIVTLASLAADVGGDVDPIDGGGVDGVLPSGEAQVVRRKRSLNEKKKSEWAALQSTLVGLCAVSSVSARTTTWEAGTRSASRARHRTAAALAFLTGYCSSIVPTALIVGPGVPIPPTGRSLTG